MVVVVVVVVVAVVLVVFVVVAVYLSASMFEGDNIKKAAILRDFLNFRT